MAWLSWSVCLPRLKNKTKHESDKHLLLIKFSCHLNCSIAACSSVWFIIGTIVLSFLHDPFHSWIYLPGYDEHYNLVSRSTGQELYTFIVCKWVSWWACAWFLAMIEMLHYFDHVLALCQWCNFPWVKALDFVYLFMHIYCFRSKTWHSIVQSKR